MLYVITFRCSSSPCSSFIAFCPLLRPSEHIARPIPAPFCFCRHATRQTRLSASGLPTDAYRYATPIFISHALRETYTQFRRKSPYTPAFAADTAARHPVLPLSTPSIPASGAGERISLRFRFMWNMRLVIHQNLNVYRDFCSFMHIYTLRHCLFFRLCVRFCRPCDPFSIVAPRLTIARLDAALLHPVPLPAESHACRLIDSRLHSLSAIESLVPRFLDLFSSHTCDRRDVRSFCLYFSLSPDFCL